MRSFLKQAASVTPSQRQQVWFDLEMYAFIHFGVNTFTNREWGDGTEEESIFHPEKLDCDQWVRAIKRAGLKGMVLTAKHHDGFCLWPSRYTEHSVKNSPCPVDVVKMAAEACRRGGIQFGFYLSPWDRNSKLYGTEAYNDYFCNQLTELLTQYGDIFYVWFDNACGEGPNGKKQVYDFPRYIELIRKYQPNAVIFNDFGPDIRWCGNEAGRSRHAEWSVVPSELCHYAEIQTGPGPLAEGADLSYLYNTDEEIGTLSNILYSKGLVYCPSEIDVSIRKGWFWHPEESPHSLEKLRKIYLASVGSNACLNLNIPPNRDGLLDERDVARLSEFGDMIRNEFGSVVPSHISREELTPSGQGEYTLELDEPVDSLRYVILEEDLSQGQRVESFDILGEFFNGSQYPLYQGTAIGHKKICPLGGPFADQNPLIAQQIGRICTLKVRIKAARGPLKMRSIRLIG